MLEAILTAALIVLAVIVWLGPEIWWLIDVARERGRRPGRVRLRDGPVGATATARRDFRVRGGFSRGPVFVDGEVWIAQCSPATGIRSGDELRITGRRGLRLLVEPAARPDDDAPQAGARTGSETT